MPVCVGWVSVARGSSRNWIFLYVGGAVLNERGARPIHLHNPFIHWAHFLARCLVTGQSNASGGRARSTIGAFSRNAKLD